MDDLVVTILTKKKKTVQKMASRKSDRKINLAWRRFFSRANGRKRRALARKLARNYKRDYFNSPEF